jgi:hypothetical protein
MFMLETIVLTISFLKHSHVNLEPLIFLPFAFLFVKKSWFYYYFPLVKISPCPGEIAARPPFRQEIRAI